MDEFWNSDNNDDLQSPAQPAQELNNEVQAGFVEIFSPPVDPVLQEALSSSGPSPMA
jgi:hypothetical protein